MKLDKTQKRLCYSVIFPALFKMILIQLFRMADSIMLGPGIYAYSWCIFADQLVGLAVMAIVYPTGHWKRKLK